MLSFGLTNDTTSTVGFINSKISSVGLYAIGDSSSVPEHTDVEKIPDIDFSKSSNIIFFLA